MKGPPATVALFLYAFCTCFVPHLLCFCYTVFCGAFVVLLLCFCCRPLTSYFFRLFPLLGEIRLTFVDIFILWVFCMLYAIICHHNGVQLHRSSTAERCPFAAHTPLKALEGRILPVSCQGYIYPCFTAVSPQTAFRKPWRVSVQAWHLGTNTACQGCPGTLCFSRSPAVHRLKVSCFCHVFVTCLSWSFPLPFR